MKIKSQYHHPQPIGENYDKVDNVVIPGRYKSMSELITRYVNGSSTGSIVHNVMYDDNPDIDSNSILDDNDFSLCDIPQAEQELGKRFSQEDRINVTTMNDDAIKTIPEEN